MTLSLFYRLAIATYCQNSPAPPTLLHTASVTSPASPGNQTVGGSTSFTCNTGYASTGRLTKWRNNTRKWAFACKSCLDAHVARDLINDDTQTRKPVAFLRNSEHAVGVYKFRSLCPRNSNKLWYCFRLKWECFLGQRVNFVQCEWKHSIKFGSYLARARARISAPIEIFKSNFVWHYRRRYQPVLHVLRGPGGHWHVVPSQLFVRTYAQPVVLLQIHTVAPCHRDMCSEHSNQQLLHCNRSDDDKWGVQHAGLHNGRHDVLHVRHGL